MQQDALIGTRNVFLQACPGSGKTTAVAGRVAWLRAAGAKVALVSFTNIGAGEIMSKVQNAHGLTVAGDGYAGTIHAFLQRYVLTPFAHRLTGSNVAVRIDPRSVELQDPAGINSQDYTFHANGSIRFNDPSKGAPLNQQSILNVKLAAAKEGVVSANDGLYWAVRVLAEVPGAAAALARRFDEIIVDEAQDTTEFQLLSLGWIRSAGLGSLVLVGDYDQSIYGFNGARRDLCQKFSEEWGLLPKLLTENYRSSQEICNVSGRLRGTSPADTAVGADKAFGVRPQVFLYSPGDEGDIAEYFRELVESHGLDTGNSAILSTSNHLCSIIRGQRQNLLPRDLSLLFEAKTATSGVTLLSYQSLERLMRRLAFGPRPSGLDLDPLVIRNAVVHLLADLPVPGDDLHSWAKGAIVSTDLAVLGLTSSPHATLHSELDDDIDPELGESSAKRTDIRVSTIHGVKGESIDAVALVMTPQSERQRYSGYAGPAGVLAQRLSDPGTADLDKDEWRRGSYVAMTRARKLLAVAVPDSDEPSALRLYFSAGFQLFSPHRKPRPGRP
jgi:DNA helicase-2/ATP-dependent DNA helicase PcrA